jgi:hypothetical protein
MLGSGVVKSLLELVRKERVHSSYVSRIVNLTTLAPDILAAILDEILPPQVTLFGLAVDRPAMWEAQRLRIPLNKMSSKLSSRHLPLTSLAGKSWNLEPSTSRGNAR